MSGKDLNRRSPEDRLPPDEEAPLTADQLLLEMAEDMAATRDATEHLCYLQEKQMLARGEIQLDDCLYQDNADG